MAELPAKRKGNKVNYDERSNNEDGSYDGTEEELHDEESAAAGGKVEEEEKVEPVKKKKKTHGKKRNANALKNTLDQNKVDEEVLDTTKSVELMIPTSTRANNQCKFFINKELKENIWKHYDWKKTKVPRLEKDGALSIGARKDGTFNKHVSRYILSLLQVNDENLAAIFEEFKKVAVGEHDTSNKADYRPNVYYLLVHEKTNGFFRSSKKSDRPSVYPGVNWYPSRKRWRVQFRPPGEKKKNFGYYVNEKNARDRAVELYDEFYNDDDQILRRCYVTIYNSSGDIEPTFHVAKKMSDLFKIIRKNIEW